MHSEISCLTSSPNPFIVQKKKEKRTYTRLTVATLDQIYTHATLSPHSKPDDDQGNPGRNVVFQYSSHKHVNFYRTVHLYSIKKKKEQKRNNEKIRSLPREKKVGKSFPVKN